MVKNRNGIAEMKGGEEKRKYLANYRNGGN